MTMTTSSPTPHLRRRMATTVTPRTLISTWILLLTVLSSFPSDATAFTPIRSVSSHGSLSHTLTPARSIHWQAANSIKSMGTTKCLPKSTTSISMYNLPPGRGGGGGGDDVGGLLRSVFVLVLSVVFFLSPLGGLVLGLFNSFLVLLFLLPLIVTVGFQVWSSLSTVTGTCPNCGAPATVLKFRSNDPPSPSLCFNCGAVIQANRDNAGIDNVTGRMGLDDLTSVGGGESLGNSIFDLFSQPMARTTTTATTTVTEEEKKSQDKQRRREKTIIDVDVEEESEQPFQ